MSQIYKNRMNVIIFAFLKLKNYVWNRRIYGA